MNHKYFLVFFCFISTLIFAQDQTKSWLDGPLNWNDFEVKNLPDNVYVFSYELTYNTSNDKINDTIVSQILAEAYMVKNESYIDPGFKTEIKLRYFQVLLNILEIHRRKFQHKLNNLTDYVELSSAFDGTNLACEREMELFAQLSDKGKHIEVIEEWENKTETEISNLSENVLPKVDKKGFGYGVHGGFGVSTFSGGLEDYFKPSFNIGFGFEFGYNRHMIFLGGILGFSSIKQDYLDEGKWFEGERANIAVIDLAYGYTVFENKSLKITPFAGLGITEFTTEHENEVQEDYRFVDYNLAYGLQTDIKIRKKLNLIPNASLNVKEYNESSIKIRLFMTQAEFNQDISGSTINLGIEYSFFGRFFK